jgi:hypothetical protein
MKKSKHWMLLLGWVPAAAAAFAIAGCETKPAGDAEGDAAAAHDEHDEGGHGEHDEAGHPEHGPNGGVLVELGDEEYHAEVVHKDKTIFVYLLDKAAKDAVPIDAKEVTINLLHDGKPEQFALKAEPQSGDGEGKASKFVSEDAELVADLDAEKTEPRLSVTINGTPYTGEIHHHHGHAHGE